VDCQSDRSKFNFHEQTFRIGPQGFDKELALARLRLVTKRFSTATADVNNDITIIHTHTAIPVSQKSPSIIFWFSHNMIGMAKPVA
jgi:hypothetical protein